MNNDSVEMKLSRIANATAGGTARQPLSEAHAQACKQIVAMKSRGELLSSALREALDAVEQLIGESPEEQPEWQKWLAKARHFASMHGYP